MVALSCLLWTAKRDDQKHALLHLRHIRTRTGRVMTQERKAKNKSFKVCPRGVSRTRKIGCGDSTLCDLCRSRLLRDTSRPDMIHMLIIALDTPIGSLWRAVEDTSCGPREKKYANKGKMYYYRVSLGTLARFAT
jgi:hypothetical protein